MKRNVTTKKGGEIKVFKKFNVLALALLVIGQTILGPMNIASASSDSIELDMKDEQELQGEDIFEPIEKEQDEVSEDDFTDIELDETSVEPETDEELTESESDSTDKSTENENSDEVNPLEDSLEEQIVTTNNIDYEPAELNVQLGFKNLIVNGIEITNPISAAQVTPKLGDRVDLNYTFTIAADKDYGIGSTFQFDLPPALLNFDSSKLSGTITDPETGFSFDYSTSNRTVTITTKAPLEEDEIFSGTLNFMAHFSSEGANDGLEQELVIPIVGKEAIKIPFLFKPNSTGESMSKSGEASIENNGRYINWEVWTNREGADLQGATLNDVLGEGHVLSGEITVEKFSVGLTGVGDSIGNTSANAFPVNLEDGRYAYKLTYKTKVTRIQQNVTETFTNSVTLTNNGIKSNPVTATATHTYGTKLEKKIINNNKYEATWGVKYNYFGSIGTRTLTDTVSGNHEILPDTIKVYSVSVNAAGEGTKGAEVNPQPKISVSDSKKSYSVELESPNGEAYFIEYKTKYGKEFVTEAGRIENSISDGEGNTSKDGFDYSQGIFSKNRGAIDFDQKVITWTINVNVEKDMNDFIISDVFSSDTAGESRQTLVNPDTPFTISNGVETIEPPIIDPKKGFTLKFGNLEKGNFTITYKTKFDILPNGSAYPLYKNTATATWKSPNDSKEYSITDDAKYETGNTNTGNNGYKNGSFDHVSQVFNWNIAVNINKQNIKGATLVDDIKPGHKLDQTSIEVYTLNLTGGDDTGTKGNRVPEDSGMYTVSNKEDQGFTITFNQDTTDAYLITYKTVDSDDIIGNVIEGEDGAVINTDKYENTAIFSTQNDGSFTLNASTVVKNANKLINKTAKTNPDEETITWTININESHSALGDITLTDKMSENQLILPETFQIREIRMDSNGNLSYEDDWKSVVPVINSAENSFKLDLDDMTKKGYQVEYKTFFLGGDGDKFSNEASINYSGATAGVESDSGVKDQEFNFNDSGGTIESTKGKLELHKVGINPITGETKDLDGITFELWNKTGTVKLKEGITNSEGKLTFEEIRYGKYLLKEIDTPNEYKPLPEDGLEIAMNAQTNYEVNGGQLFVVENIENIETGNACTDFTLTVKDVDGYPVVNKEVTLTNSVTGQKHEAWTDANGQVKLPFNDIRAGNYTVSIDGEGATIALGNVTVQFDGECEAELQTNPACDVFTVTIEDKDNIARPNVIVTLKHKDNAEAPEITATTDQDGKFIVPYSKDLVTGVYKVYEGKQYLGDVTITFKNDPCEAPVTEAPTCETFTLTVKDVDGVPREAGVSITVKDKAGNIIETLLTDEDGKVETTIPLPAGEYDVYEEDSNEPFAEFTSSTDCSAEVQPNPSCDSFTILVKDVEDNIRPNVTITVKDKVGKEIITTKTDENGAVEVPSKDLPTGKYDTFEGELYIGEIDVKYKDGCQTEVIGFPTCTTFTLTINDRYGNPRGEGVKVTIKDSKGNTIKDAEDNSEFTTTERGIVNLDSLLKQGTYTVYENDSLIGSFEVTDKCLATVQPYSGGDGGGTPPTEPSDPKPGHPNPENPGTPDPNKPGKPDPENPGTPVPNKPGKPNPENPDTPDLNKPGKPDPENPGTPDPNKPGKPDSEYPSTPDLNKPENPDLENPGSTDSKNPDSKNPGNNVDPKQTEDQNTDGGIEAPKGNKPVSKGSVKEIANEKKFKKGELNSSNGNKLPQTGEEQFIYMIAFGILFLAIGSIVLLCQRRKV